MRAWIAVFALPLLCWASPARASLVLALDLPTLVTRADHVAVVEVASVKSDWDANHEQILSTIDLVVVESWKGGDAPASHITVVQPGGTVGDMTQIVHGMTRFVARRARRGLPGRPPRARQRRRDGAGEAPGAPRRRLGPYGRARARLGRARRSSGRRPRARPRRCSTFTRGRWTICAPTFARSPPESLRSGVHPGARPGASPGRRPAGRGEARAPWWSPASQLRCSSPGGPAPTFVTPRTAARCSSGRRAACRSRPTRTTCST